MLFTKFRSSLLAALFVLLLASQVCAHPQRPRVKTTTKVVASEVAAITSAQGAIRPTLQPVPTVAVVVNGTNQLVNTNTTNANPAIAPLALPVSAITLASTILIIARDTASAYSAYSGLNGYGIPYFVLVVPKAGVALPQLNSSATVGNYGAIVVVSEVSYDYGTTGGGFQSALTADQWTALYNYQTQYGVRMVRLDVFPGPSFGTTAIGGCCNTGVEQTIYVSNSASFPTAGLKTGATVSTLGLWHYPATISNASIATEFLQFGTAAGFPTVSTAGVINNIGGRLQMVFFIGFATDWSASSNYLQHAWIHWATRGLYTGYRRVNLNTQVDDMFLESDIYSPAGNTFRIRTGDLANHITWMNSINSRMNPGSKYFIEIAHNGNGNVERADDIDNGNGACDPGPIEYGEQIDTPLEWMKPIGTGKNIWPATPVKYPNFSVTRCLNLDSLKTWWSTASNLNAFAHISHTFTHEDENNATYYDVYNEITWNQAWLQAAGISGAQRFSTGLIPPAITGLHNGDALRAWITAGITSCVGDNTRPVLMNQVNDMWPLITTVAANGYAGMQINPRWATNIYYNCDTPACTVLEWINTSAGSGDIYALLALEKNTNTRHLLGLHHDPFMFHQANLRQTDAGMITINGVTSKLSLLQMWGETIIQEMVRLVNWPIITLKHDDMSKGFASRMARDLCKPNVAFQIDPTARTITGLTVTTNGNSCTAQIPVTVPGSVTNTQGFTTEKIGNDPLTIWVQMSGAPVSFTLTAPVAL